MSDSKTVRIRQLTAADKKLALFSIGRANLDILAVANRQLYGHPVILTAWLLLSLFFVYLMDWWPSTHRGLLGILRFLKPLPAFASVAVPIMFAIDWKNRPSIEARAQEVIREKDLWDPAEYYSQSPASGFWILEFGENFLGLIALDAHDAKKTKKGLIRHFYVEEQYRATGIQHDLLRHAVNHAFEKSTAVETIEGVDAPTLVPYIHECYKWAGFRLSPGKYRSVGAFGRWRYHTTTLQRKDTKKSD